MVYVLHCLLKSRSKDGSSKSMYYYFNEKETCHTRRTKRFPFNHLKGNRYGAAKKKKQTSFFEHGDEGKKRLPQKRSLFHGGCHFPITKKMNRPPVGRRSFHCDERLTVYYFNQQSKNQKKRWFIAHSRSESTVSNESNDHSVSYIFQEGCSKVCRSFTGIGKLLTSTIQVSDGDFFQKSFLRRKFTVDHTLQQNKVYELKLSQLITVKLLI